MPLHPEATILVFDEGQAKFYRLGDHQAGFDLVEALTFPVLGAHASDLVSDKRGRSFGPDGRHAVDPHTDPREQAKAAAIADLAHKLEDAVKRGAIEELVLVAPARALGELRRRLPKNVTDLVSAEIRKDLTNAPREKVFHAVVAETGAVSEPRHRPRHR